MFSKFLALAVGTFAFHNANIAQASDDDDLETPANIIFMIMDDMGRADIGKFGAEWDTPNLDSFLDSSLVLDNHYIGYVCSASRSQFLTGRYSYHSGYGTLDVFDIEKIGHIPLQTPTIAEYLKEYTSYKTYGIGKWQLGSPTYNNMATNRGFDKFWGFNGGKEEYITKKSTSYIDFFEDLEETKAWCDDYSTDQYFDKLIDIIDIHSRTKNADPFFVYFALQTVHDPFPDYGSDPSSVTNYYQACMRQYSKDFIEYSDRLGVCEAVLGVDTQLGRLIKHFHTTAALQKVWDNTLIVFTSDNGGSLDAGSCNYPYRGGKNTFYDGNVRVLAAVGGGKLPSSQEGKTLYGLVSNVDWVPTLLTFAGVIPHSQSMITFEDNKDVLSLDGYNMYNYIMRSEEDENDSYFNNLNQRDHVLFHLSPKLDSSNKFIKDIDSYSFDDFSEVALIFYDDNGDLWKYLSVAKSTNIIGDPIANSGWCALSSSTQKLTTDTYTIVRTSEAEDNNYTTLALYKLTDDGTEQSNYLADDEDVYTQIGDSLNPKIKGLKEIIDEKIDYYVGESDNRDYLFGNFYCFVDYISHEDAAKTAAKKANGFWVPFIDNNKQLADEIVKYCDLDTTHPIYELHTTAFTLPDSLIIDDSSINDKNNERIRRLNNRVPVVTTDNTYNAKDFADMDEVYFDDDESDFYDNVADAEIKGEEIEEEAFVNHESSTSYTRANGINVFSVGLGLAGATLFVIVSYLLYVNVDIKSKGASISPTSWRHSMDGYQTL